MSGIEESKEAVILQGPLLMAKHNIGLERGEILSRFECHELDCCKARQ